MDAVRLLHQRCISVVMPPPLNQPDSTDQRNPRRSILPISLAFLLLTIVGAVLVLLTLNIFGLVILVGAGMFVMVALHYLIWGWWIGDAIRHEETDETHK